MTRPVLVTPATSLRRGLPAAAALILLIAAPSAAWVSSTVGASDATPLIWDLSDLGSNQEEVENGIIQFRLHLDGSADVPDGSDLDALRSAFQTWENVADAEIAWSEGPALSDRSIGEDGVFSVFWDESGQFPLNGALAVTFTYFYTSGPEKGEIVDANIVFNGDYTWATDGNPNAYDIESVAAHEIGHSFGLDHSPLGAATLWPYAGDGETFVRSLTMDDETAITAKYETPLAQLANGSIRGFVSQSGSGLLHGAHVVALDTDGNVVSGTLSLSDGSYRLDALPAGDYTLYAEAIGTPRFGSGNLGSYFSGSDTGFLGLYNEVPATVSAGLTTTRDLLLGAGNSTLTVRWVGRSDNPVWNSSMVQVEAGEGPVEIGMAVEGMPLTGTPLSVSGTDLPVQSTRFATVGGIPTALVTIDVHGGIASGFRSLIVEVGGERVRGSGVLEIRAAPSIDDADGDTVGDLDEGGPTLDTDSDGTPDYLDLDSDGDTILDSDEAGDESLSSPPVDSDGDGLPDLRDPDADNDTIADEQEAGDTDPNTAPVDTDLDGVADFLDDDSDADVILDSEEAGDVALSTLPLDTDLDGRPDYIDDDSDGDSILDLHEAGDASLVTPALDFDLDGLPDYRDDDSDGDTILDADEAGDSDPASVPEDADGDLVRNFRDLDSDGDSIADSWEAGDSMPATAPADSDSDGVPDFLDDDSDADGIGDAWEAGDADLLSPPRDSDTDGVADVLDADSDGDTLSDALEAGDADVGTEPVDTDQDGVADVLDMDADGDTVPDGVFPEDGTDFDGDGLENFRDIDSDDGGETDGSELDGGRDPLNPADDLNIPPGPVPDGTTGGVPLVVNRDGAQGIQIFWDAATGASSYRVYRGSLAVLNAGGWDAAVSAGAGTCDTQGAQSFADVQELGGGEAWFYLVAGLNVVGEGSLGTGVAGNDRPAGIGCP